MLEQLRTALDGLVLRDQKFSGRIGLGLVDAEDPAAAEWLVVAVEGGNVSVEPDVLRTREGLASAEPVVSQLSVDIAVAGDAVVWESLTEGGREALVTATEGQTLSIQGDLSMFIRYMLPVLEVLLGGHDQGESPAMS